MDTDVGSGIVVLSGPPCAGKSSVGRLLRRDESDRCRRTYVAVDAVFDLLFPDSDRNRGDRMLAYDSAHLLARGLCERGLTPVLECTYARAEQRSSLAAALADMPTVPLWIVEIEVSAAEAVRRFRARDEATDLDEDLLRERVENFPYGDQALRLVSSPDSPPEALADRIDDWLRGSPEPAQPDLWVAAGRDW
jgi:predicted kinase